MPHLSPIIWTALCFMLWTLMLLFISTLEFYNTSLTQ